MLESAVEQFNNILPLVLSDSLAVGVGVGGLASLLGYSVYKIVDLFTNLADG